MIWSAGLGYTFHVLTISWCTLNNNNNNIVNCTRTERRWGKLFQHDFQREGGFCVLFLLGVMETEPNPQPKF
jgi:hypothetical protein